MTRALLLAASRRTPTPPPVGFAVTGNLDATVVPLTITSSAYGTDVIPGHARLGWSSTRLRVDGFLPAGTTGTPPATTNALPGNDSAAPYAVSFRITGAARFALHVRAPSYQPSLSGLLVSVDGHPATAQTRLAGTETLTVDLPDVGSHLVRLDLNELQFGGIDVPAAATVTKPGSTSPSLMIYGDSYVQGFNLDPDGDQRPRLEDFAWLTGRILDAPTATLGLGGTGYTTSTDNFGDGARNYLSTLRLDMVEQVAPDYLVILGSVNDASNPGTAAATLYADLAERVPATKVIVVGVQSVNTTSNAGRVFDDALRAAATAAPNVIGFVSPRTDAWITDANSGQYMDPVSTIHLSAAGNRYYAERLAAAIVAITSTS